MEPESRVVVTDLKMPFWSMVVFMVKWAIAAIPALLILYAIGMALIVAVPSFISGYAGYGTSTARTGVDACIQRGLEFMGPQHRDYVETICKGDPSMADNWK